MAGKGCANPLCCTVCTSELNGSVLALSPGSQWLISILLRETLNRVALIQCNCSCSHHSLLLSVLFLCIMLTYIPTYVPHKIPPKVGSHPHHPKLSIKHGFIVSHSGKHSLACLLSLLSPGLMSWVDPYLIPLLSPSLSLSLIYTPTSSIF